MKKLILTLFILVFSFVFIAYAKDIIVLSGGRLGNITFPHKEHQITLKKCSLCHNLFDKKTGIIQKLKDDKKLDKKAVMANCIKCHKEIKKSQNKKNAPTSCRACHKK